MLIDWNNNGNPTLGLRVLAGQMYPVYRSPSVVWNVRTCTHWLLLSFFLFPFAPRHVTFDHQSLSFRMANGLETARVRVDSVCVFPCSDLFDLNIFRFVSFFHGAQPWSFHPANDPSLDCRCQLNGQLSVCSAAGVALLDRNAATERSGLQSLRQCQSHAAGRFTWSSGHSFSVECRSNCQLRSTGH